MLRVFALGLLLGCGAAAAWAAPAAPANHLKVAENTISDTTSVAGTVEGVETAEARARISGTVDEIKVSRGELVKKGQVLAVVRDRKLGQQSAGLKTQLESAEKNLARLQELLPLDAASPAQVEQAQAQVAALRAQAQNTGQNSADGRVLAPFDGQFVALRLTSGTVVMAGESLGTVAAQPLRLRLQLPERHAARLQIGDVLPLADESGAALGSGDISRIYPQVENGKVMVDVALPETLKPLVGQKLMAAVVTGQRRGILVPQGAVSVRNNLSFVRLASGSDVLVQTGEPLPDGSIEILSGLRAGDEIIVP